MTETPVVLIVLVSIGALALSFGLFVVVPSLVLGALRKPLMERVQRRYPPADILRSDLRASSFGLESRGVMQARGNGALVLTRNELCFFQFLPSREDLVPLGKITETSIVRSHLGKATPFPLVKVRFEGAAGPDSIAVRVPDAEGWRNAIDEIREGT